jgi:hypothetical protein
VKCSNCGGEIHDGEATKSDGAGGWRHPSKCGPELRDLVVRRQSGCHVMRSGEKGLG